MVRGMDEVTQWFATPEELDIALRQALLSTKVVLDVGCGIRPMSYFRPDVHLCVEPFDQYVEILQNRFIHDNGCIIIKSDALLALQKLPDRSVDSIFLVDVIEHLDKEIGEAVIVNCERVARQQIAVFTPYGYMPQHYEEGATDGWGLNGIAYQEHRSGWEPSDFGAGWRFLCCETFHRITAKGEPLQIPHGAFWAIRTIPDQRPSLPRKTAIIGDHLPPFCEDHFALVIAEGFSHYAPESYELMMIGDSSSYAGHFQTKKSRLDGSYISLGPDMPRTGKLIWMVKIFANMAKALHQGRYEAIVLPHRPTGNGELLTVCAIVLSALSRGRLTILKENVENEGRRWFRWLSHGIASTGVGTPEDGEKFDAVHWIRR